MAMNFLFSLHRLHIDYIWYDLFDLFQPKIKSVHIDIFDRLYSSDRDCVDSPQDKFCCLALDTDQYEPPTTSQDPQAPAAHIKK